LCSSSSSSSFFLLLLLTNLRKKIKWTKQNWCKLQFKREEGEEATKQPREAITQST
jgi:hypothetical protein